MSGGVPKPLAGYWNSHPGEKAGVVKTVAGLDTSGLAFSMALALWVWGGTMKAQ